MKFAAAWSNNVVLLPRLEGKTLAPGEKQNQMEDDKWEAFHRFGQGGVKLLLLNLSSSHRQTVTLTLFEERQGEIELLRLGAFHFTRVDSIRSVRRKKERERIKFDIEE